MLNSLLLGPKALMENGQKAFEVRDEFKLERHFQINYNETILPQIELCAENIFLVDFAEQQDHDGVFTELLESFIERYLLQKSKQVRLIVPFTIEQLLTNQGSDIIKQIQLIQKKFASNMINESINSIQPVLIISDVDNNNQMNLKSIK